MDCDDVTSFYVYLFNILKRSSQIKLERNQKEGLLLNGILNLKKNEYNTLLIHFFTSLIKYVSLYFSKDVFLS